MTLNIQAQEPPASTSHQSLDEIHNLVSEDIKQKIGQQIFEPTIKLRKLSSTLELPQCQQPLELNDRSPDETIGRMTYSVSCHQPNWRVFVPAVVDGKQAVIMTTQGILKQAVIKSEDLKRVLLPYKQVRRGSVINLDTAIGMRTKKSISANSILRIKDLQPPYWVFKKQQVTLITKVGSIQVKTKGIALQNAVEQQQVPVRNSNSDRVVKGIVIAPNTVYIP
ncbi:flagellar basal body P-ring formation chaperone FlgA [Thiomicrorhabdus arctica]|uniref:flagellar basal body P-ring formation chaperone FlgA n=1 Tax=Thiomicrorhabdus arctica TaxID=131540 RepID=UPI000363823B|nr:flagellar basal body P-ring formation chaperone FlgA [Thiomicrorhabdus arctica]